eukprot:GILK01001739.1.p1 GENE.GILK01001739.1~~GILK01001739.1.p1  ORF type:complete len:213 (-),score=31.97 GILK01001739.1:205-843(-)
MSSNENISPKVLNVIARELRILVSSPPDGIKFILNEDDLTDIQADIHGPEQTPYEGGVFRVKFVLGSDFPVQPPKAYFLTKIFHPNVSKIGEICVNTLKRDWKPDNWSIGHILAVIRCLLIVPFPESSLNEEAGRLFMESYAEYSKHAQLMTQIHAIRREVTEKGEQPSECREEEASTGAGEVPLASPSKKRLVNKEADRSKAEKKRSLKRL